MNPLDRVPRIRDRLDDPIVARWALDRLSWAKRVGSREAGDLDSTLFDDVTILRLLERGEPGVANRLLVTIDPDRLRSATPWMARQWDSSKSPMLVNAVPIIAENDPDHALLLFERDLRRTPSRIDLDRLSGIATGLSKLAPERGREASKLFVDFVTLTKDKSVREMFLWSAVRLAWAARFRTEFLRVVSTLAASTVRRGPAGIVLRIRGPGTIRTLNDA